MPGLTRASATPSGSRHGDARRLVRQPDTLAADRGFHARDFVMELRERRVTPHIAQNTSGRRSEDARVRFGMGR